MPKAAATPAATTPDPYSRPMAIMVAAAALDELVVTAAATEDEAGAEVLAAVDVGALLLEEEDAGAVKLLGSK